MNKTSFPTSRLLLLLCLCSAGSISVQNAALATEGARNDASEQSYRAEIDQLESSQGAYGAALPETLLGLGLSLQSQGRHEEAIQVFSRGMHLARINDGLYGKTQIPLLEGQIASYLALGDYTQADDRQHYLYRVQVRSLERGDALISALMQQAQWQYQAYRVSNSGNSHGRLTNMWDLYGMAVNNILERDGGVTSNTLPPLRGLLRTQYLISRYQPAQSLQTPPDEMASRQNLYRFKNYYSQNYDRGTRVIEAIVGIETGQLPEDAEPPTEALVLLGDWQLWHGKTDIALQSYLNAATELAPEGDAQVLIDRLLPEPVPLPDVDGLRPLPAAIDPDEGGVKLEFGVDERGRVENVMRLDENEDLDSQARRLMRALRKTRFRPRFESGQPVDTQNIVRAFKVD